MNSRSGRSDGGNGTRACSCVIVVQPRRHALDVLHHQVALDRMQAATRRTGFLEEDGVLADPYFGMRGKHALHQLSEQFQRGLVSRIEIAAGGPACEEVIESVAGYARQVSARPHPRGARPRSAADQCGAQLRGGLGAVIPHVLHSIDAPPTRERMQHRGQWVPTGRAHCLVLRAMACMAPANTNYEPKPQQTFQCSGRMLRQGARVGPLARAECAKQLALGGIDLTSSPRCGARANHCRSRHRPSPPLSSSSSSKASRSRGSRYSTAQRRTRMVGNFPCGPRHRRV